MDQLAVLREFVTAWRRGFQGRAISLFAERNGPSLSSTRIRSEAILAGADATGSPALVDSHGSA